MRNLTLLTDFYQLTMMNGYLKCGTADREAVFDVFYRGGAELSYVVTAGLEQVVEYIENLHFEETDIEYLRGLKCFDEEFLTALKNFKFTGDVYSVPEGTVMFPFEPLLTVKAPLFQAQLVETAILCILNHQTLIATKAARLSNATKSTILEFGLRRAQGPDAGIYGARAAYIGGCRSTSNVLAGQMFDIAVKGTHAHSWVMSFPDELSAFRAYAELYPDNCLLLVDTYDTLKSGVPNAIKVFDELKAKGYKPSGIRLDSGDLAYLSKQARKMLDAAGHEDCKIFASGDIDEDVLLSLQIQGAKIDIYGIGTRLITSYRQPSLGGVYKLAAMEDENGVLVPKMKLSDSKVKMTNPGLKKVVRLYNEDGMAEADLICLKEETFDTAKPLTIYHPEKHWISKTLENFTVKELQVTVFEKGKQVYNLPNLHEIGRHEDESMAEFHEEYRRTLYPAEFKVDLSDKLYDLKMSIIRKNGKNI
ncbi:MAG: nicotinate phosphoribosyltransferase [Eubacteriales bacterium]|nr:nicotinate phosphoribosyltransferase [Eubacteriales bacterium]